MWPSWARGEGDNRGVQGPRAPGSPSQEAGGDPGEVFTNTSLSLTPCVPSIHHYVAPWTNTLLLTPWVSSHHHNHLITNTMGLLHPLALAPSPSIQLSLCHFVTNTKPPLWLKPTILLQELMSRDASSSSDFREMITFLQCFSAPAGDLILILNLFQPFT